MRLAGTGSTNFCGSFRGYRVAERIVSFAPAVAALEPFAADVESRRATPRPDSDRARRHRGRLVRRGEGWLGGAVRSYDCRWREDGYALTVPGVGRFGVSAPGELVTWRRDGEPRCDGDRDLAEIALGPPLILALALQGAWCLHASAVEIDGRAVAFAGASGAGKSTLAATLPELSGNGSAAVRCAADDIFPVAMEADRACGLPRFPQLKYGLDRQPAAQLPAALPLAAIYVLEPAAAATEANAAPLAGNEAVFAVVRHTVASRLFVPELLGRHLDFCVRLAQNVPIRRLAYPKTPASPRQVAGLIFRNEFRNTTCNKLRL